MNAIARTVMEWVRPCLSTGFETAIEVRRAESTRRQAEIEESLSKIDVMIKVLSESNPSAAAMMEIDKVLLSQRRRETD